MALQSLPPGWDVSDLQRFNQALDAATAYTQFDYVRKIVAANNQFLQQRQTDLGNLVLALGQAFISQWVGAP